MSTAAEELLAQALKLAPEDREMVATELAASLEKDPGYDDAWAAEVGRRIDRADSGRVSSIPWETVRAELYDRINEYRTG